LKKTISTFRNGKPAVQIIFNDKTDTTSGQILQYYTDGKIYKKATIYKKRYVDRKVTYYSSGQISQIDSLSQPCDLNIDQCNGTVIRYHENGNISQRYSVNNHELNGMTQQFTRNGKIAKEYELIHDTIKNGIYREFYDNGRISFQSTYKNDTITGFCYYFNEQGDTLKYYNHFNGALSFPYKKWLDNRQILYGDYTDRSEKSVTWIWRDKSGKEIKRKVAGSKKYGFVVPD